MAAHSPDLGVTSWTDATNLLAEKAFLQGFAAVAERGLSFDIWVYGHQLPDAVVLAREYPETTFILDHYATPVGALGPRGRHTGATAAERKSITERWHDELAAVAALPNVVAKHSGMGMPVLGLGPVPRNELRDAIAPFLIHVDDVFGPERTFWSSNFPIDKPNVTLADSVWILRDVLDDRIDEDAMFRANALRTYRVDSRAT
jgi:predicted TIM-barrel fold metal-dependent hydrolase